MRLEQIFVTLIIALLAGTLGAYLVLIGSTTKSAQPAPIVAALEQVVNSGKLRCGYIEEEQVFTKSVSGAFPGIWYRLSETLADHAKLSIVWTAATTPDTLASDLKAKKFDALCTGLTPTLILAKELGFSAPAYYRNGQPYGFVTLASAHDLRDFLSLGLTELQDQGITETVLQKFEPKPSPYQRIKAAKSAP